MNAVAPTLTADVDLKAVETLAQIAIEVLREQGMTDFEILNSHYLGPHDNADRMFERRQIRDKGRVFAPPAMVKARMRALLAN